MKWTIRIELTPDGNEPITRDVGTITRPIADLYPEQVGLSLEEGQQLLRCIQMEIITAQARGYELCRRPCAACGRPRRIRDVRTKCVQTIFGAFRFRGRRYDLVSADIDPRNLGRTFHWAKSSQGERLRKYVFCSPNWVRRCRIEPHRGFCDLAVLPKCERVIGRFVATQWNTRCPLCLRGIERELEAISIPRISRAARSIHEHGHASGDRR
jgi:hypothetical protein